MTTVPDDPRMAAASRDEVLAAFVRQHPDAFVVAISPIGLFTEMPDELRATGLRPIEAEGTALGLAVQEDQAAVLEAWFRVQNEGVANCLFHPLGTPGEVARLHYIDMTHRWGVFTAMVTGLTASAARRTLAAEAVRPRLVSARKDATAKIIGIDPAVEVMLGWTPAEHRASTIAALDECNEPGRSRGTAVVFIDLNEFKQVNDRYGHAVGDRLLTYVAGRLRTAVRDGDVVGRFGGDEFVVVCRDVATAAVAQRIGETLLAALDAAGPDLAGITLRPQASIGVAWSRPGPAATDVLIARADAAMYEAKKARTGRLALMMAD